MTTESAIKEYLDSLSQLPGSILYRDTTIWRALAPGLPGQRLTVAPTLLPQWTDSPSYLPAMMQFNGFSATFLKTNFTATGNDWTFVAAFTHPPTTVNKTLFHFRANTRVLLTIFTTVTGKIFINGWDTTNTKYLDIVSTMEIDDDQLHTMWLSYTKTPLHFEFKIDAIDADNLAFTNRKLLSATMPTSINADMQVGSQQGSTKFWAGTIGFLGIRQASGLSWEAFFNANGLRKPIDTIGWEEWGGTPLAWHEAGKMDENRGSIGNFTNNGPVLLAQP